MKISRIETLHADGGWRVFSYVKISTDEGIVGWSEFYETYWSRGLTQVIRRLADSVVGEDPRPVARLTAKLSTMTLVTEGGLMHQAIAAIENACLDIKAKALGIPVYALFGGPYRETLPLYWSHCGSFRARFPKIFEEEIGLPPMRTLDDVKALGTEVVARGFSALKTNPILFDERGATMASPGFSPNPTDFARNPDKKVRNAIVDVLEAFRDGVGPDLSILLDLNFSMRAEGLTRVAHDVERFDLTWLELDIFDPRALAAIRAASRTPIGSLEAIHGRRGYKPYFENNAVDVAIVDAPWNGFIESVKIAAMAEAYELNVAPHNFCGHLYTLINAHLAAAIPNFRILEIEVDDVPWKDDLVTHAPVVKDGHMVLPTGPGWGTDVLEEAVRAHPPREKGWPASS